YRRNTDAHESAFALARSADRQSVDTKRRLAYAHRYALPIFAARADPGIQCEIVADHRYFRQRVGTIADQCRAFYRMSDLAVFDHPSLGSGKHEFTAGDVDLSATEVRGVETAFHRRDDLLRIALTCKHHRVGHTRHRQMGE